jgi:cytochrome c
MRVSKFVLPLVLLMGGSALAQAPATPAAPAGGAAAPAAGAAAPAAAPLPAPITPALGNVTFGIGRTPTAAELAASSITIYPDGRGLPAGSGDPKTGAKLFADNCAACHGDGAKGGISAAPNLLGTMLGSDVDAWNRGTGQDGLPTKSPSATILYDFIHRGMPLGAEGTLSADDYYALTAYLLAINQIIPQDMVLNQDNLAKVKMPMNQAPGKIDPTKINTQVPNTYFVSPGDLVYARPSPGTQRLAGYPY